MSHGRVRSTIFRDSSPLSKEEQERIVGGYFRQAYEQDTGVILTGNLPAIPDPPDRLFTCQGLTIGIELFELEQLYATRALVELLTNEIYSELGRKKLYDQYEGISTHIVLSLGISTAEEAQIRWRQQSVNRNPASVFAAEFVNLLTTRVSPRDAIPDKYPGIIIRVDASAHPAISALSNLITVSKSPITDIRRSDGRSAPLVIIGGGVSYTESEMTDSISRKIAEKIQRKPYWQPVDHAILVAHDIPRDRIYESLGQEWVSLIERAANQANILQLFDELWLVTCQKMIIESKRICGQNVAHRS